MMEDDGGVENGDDLPPPELRCKLSSKGWQCKQRRIKDHTLCEKHYIQRHFQKMRSDEKRKKQKRKRKRDDQTQETGAMVQNDSSFPSPNPTGSSALRTSMDIPQAPSGVRDIMCERVLSISRSTCGSMDDDQSTTNETDSPSNAVLSSLENMITEPKSNAEDLGSFKKITEEAKEALSFPTTIHTRNTEEEATNKSLTVVQMDCRQFLIPTVEEHQTFYLCADESNHQGVETTEDDRTLQSSVDMTMDTYSSPRQQDEGSTILENAKLPFIKSSHMWEHIESNEVFKLIPQNPHFRPLEKENEELREGIAFGQMLSFTNLMERTSKARLDDPKSMFETRLKALTDLENFGFTVEPVRSRLEEMLKIRDSCSQLDRLKTVEKEIFEGKRQCDETQESITRLNMQLQVLLKEKEKRSSKVDELQRMAGEIKESIQEARHEFQKVVAATWN